MGKCRQVIVFVLFKNNKFEMNNERRRRSEVVWNSDAYSNADPLLLLYA